MENYHLIKKLILGTILPELRHTKRRGSKYKGRIKGDIFDNATRTNRLGSLEGTICFNASLDYIDREFITHQEK